MKQYLKNNIVSHRPKSIIFNGKTYLNPKDEILIAAGYEIKEVENPPVTNDTIKNKRQAAYRLKADQYFIAYQAYTELGESDKANEMRELWIKERESINKQYPYIEE